MAAQSLSNTRRETLYTRRQIEALIAEGRSIIVKNGKVLKVDAWLPYHPGGDKAIKHMIGQDATDQVQALHSAEALARMDRYQIGKIEGRWENFIPPIQGGRFRSLADEVVGVDGQDSDAQSSSSRSSVAEDEVFDSDEQRLRRRHIGNQSHSRDTSATSVSSTEAVTYKPKPSDPGLAHLDARTQEEINFDLASYPSLDPVIQDEVIQKYRLLNERIKAEGLYQCPYSAYAWECLRYAFLFCLFLTFLHVEWYIASAISLGLLWHQLVFTVHDAGHMGITHNYQIDTGIGILIADFIGGLSVCWWKHNHNVHHVVTNSPEHDPDIEHMPFFAISHRFFQSLKSTYYDRIMTYDPFAKFTLRYQHLLYYPILAFGRFNLYFLSWSYIILGQGPRKGAAAWHRWFELVGQVFFWIWFGYFTLYRSIDGGWNRFLFLLISHVTTMPTHVQITLSHFAMSTADLGPAESFPQKMLRTTMDVDCPPWLDFVHGGLQFQAVHHLFPRLPRHNLRKAQKLVIEFCEETKIPYAVFGFAEGNGKVIGRLGEVAGQARLLAECQKVVSKERDFGMH
ncbi:MAG: hypothetical protein M1820_001675 [Bogoriella megaspora]|nr:MAG: hypothetical protein M1820_001675 [Bogoriella megaspora]